MKSLWTLVFTGCILMILCLADSELDIKDYSPLYQTNNLNDAEIIGHSQSKDYTLDNNLWNNTKTDDFNELPPHFDADSDNLCMLGSIKPTFMWWSYPNGSLRPINYSNLPILNYVDLSHRQFSTDEAIYGNIETMKVVEVEMFSAAFNKLTSVPQKTLGLISHSLKYLTLRGNKFYSPSPVLPNDVNKWGANSRQDSVDGGDYTSTSMLKYNSTQLHGFISKLFSKNDARIAWAQFPKLPNLIELDLSNCHIEFVTKTAFRNLSNLKNLYMSHNKMLTIPFDTFYHMQSLQFLDLSHTNAFDYSLQASMPTLDTFVNMVNGLKIQQSTFKYLPKLVYLDLSHTKLTRNSAVAFAHLGKTLKYLSVCYTSFPMVGNTLFKNTALVGLDISGNTYAAYNMIVDAFEGISDTLRVLYFERSNLKDISWVSRLKNLTILSLAGNNVNSVSFDIFSQVANLQVLDLSANHLGNWYSRVFSNNHKLRVLNLRENNINIITSEMLKDFSGLDYLGLGENNFVCDCLLRDLVDLASFNTESSDCPRSLKQNAQKVIDKNLQGLHDMAFNVDSPFNNVNISSIWVSTSLARIRNRLKKKSATSNLKRKYKLQLAFRSLRAKISSEMCRPKETPANKKNGTLNGSQLTFQLLDYQEDHFWCFNGTEKISFSQLTCHRRSIANDVAVQLHSFTVYVVSCVCTFLVVSIVGLIIYFKRWYIYYYYSSLKSAVLLSSVVKESADIRNALLHNEPNKLYDIFISYCQKDREWVFKELVPNIEDALDITVCLHERDFQVGDTIVENIVSCMERSRGLMLIISSSFLLSQWCKFEMYLAQRRLFEDCNDQLILVFLEDIPRNKRPKHLQHLMDVKTYIIWPGAKSKRGARAEDCKIFWKRLRRALNI